MAGRSGRVLGVGLAALLAVTAPAVAAQTDDYREVAPNGLTSLKLTAGRTSVRIGIATHEPKAAEKRRNARTACTGSRIPCSLLDELTITVDGKQVPVPRSAVLQFADVNRAKVSQLKSGAFELVLDCGDASEGYDAHILFNRERVLRLDIIDGEGGVLAERTVYEDLSHVFDN